MIFPGRKPLLEKISTQNMRVDDLVSEFSSQNFSGYVEFHFEEAKGILLFHSGEIITTVFKDKDKIKTQDEGLTAIKNRCRLEEGEINTYQLPSEMAHMLRGLCNRKFLESIHVSGKLELVVDGLHQEGHTGTLDLIFTERKEKGMILLINGRISNTFLEMDKNLTLEGGDALKRIHELVDEMNGSCKIYRSDFSQEIWKSRRGTQQPTESRIYEILTRQEKSEPSPLWELLAKFSEEIDTPPFTAFFRKDGTLLAKILPKGNKEFPLDDLHRIIQEATPLFNSLVSGELKELLCTSEERNLLLRALPQEDCFHVLILDRANSPKNLRKCLASLDREIAALSLETVQAS